MNAIKVVDYDPAWPALFEAQKRTILLIVGDMVEDIHHIGSTSIAGLCAKPKIDIHAVLRSHELIPDAIELVKRHGYAFQGDPYNDGMWTFTQGHGSYGTRLYLCGPDNAMHIKRIRFRDYLRAHPEWRERLSEHKWQLAERFENDKEAYIDAKAPMVLEILVLALAEQGAPA